MVPVVLVVQVVLLMLTMYGRLRQSASQMRSTRTKEVQLVAASSNKLNQFDRSSPEHRLLYANVLQIFSPPLKYYTDNYKYMLLHVL